MTRVTVWNEFRHEKDNPAVRRVYPDGIHAVIAPRPCMRPGSTRCARRRWTSQRRACRRRCSRRPRCWSGGAIARTPRSRTSWSMRVQRRVLAGMGLVVLHSAHFSKIFKRLMGTPCTLKWRDDGERERIWTVAPGHPVAAGVPPRFELEREEMYSEPFEVPPPEELVFVSWFAGGEVFRSGCCYRRGRGRIFYFRPGHETFPTYLDPTVQRVIANAVRWTAPDAIAPDTFVNERVEPIEPLKA